jgi:hypothetical protein
MNPNDDFAAIVDAANVPLEHRKEKRFWYFHPQRVAFCSGPEKTPGTFATYHFYDLSTHGCSFLSVVLPPSEDLIIEFGEEPKVISMLARIAHVNPKVVNGKDMFLIGCRFMSRAE